MREACLNGVLELAREDDRVVFIGSDLSPTTLSKMKEEFPKRFFMEGVAEQNLVGVAAGLAMEGFIPYVNTIATFLTRRCYEQIVVDACLHHLPIRFLGNGGGLIYAPLGPTHLALEDITIMRALPNMTVLVPSDREEMRELMPQTLNPPGPIYVRIGGGEPVLSIKEERWIGKTVLAFADFADSNEMIIFVSTGMMTANCIEAAKKAVELGVCAKVLHVHTVSPLDIYAIKRHFRRDCVLVTVEEGYVSGLGGAVAEAWEEDNNFPGAHHARPSMLHLGVPKVFPERYGINQGELLTYYGLTPSMICWQAMDFLHKQ